MYGFRMEQNKIGFSFTFDILVHAVVPFGSAGDGLHVHGIHSQIGAATGVRSAANIRVGRRLFPVIIHDASNAHRLIIDVGRFAGVRSSANIGIRIAELLRVFGVLRNAQRVRVKSAALRHLRPAKDVRRHPLRLDFGACEEKVGRGSESFFLVISGHRKYTSLIQHHSVIQDHMAVAAVFEVLFL